jgi:hypothetical protein
MPYKINVELHPLGLVVENEEGERELLIEGETCCSLSYDELKRIANSTCKFEIDDEKTGKCRLKQSAS